MSSLVICGASGAMGQVLLEEISQDSQWNYLGALSPRQGILGEDYDPQVIIDFSRPENLDFVMEYAKKHHAPLLLCTTGYTQAQLETIRLHKQGIPILLSANNSVGIEALRRIIQLITPMLKDFDIGITDKHHRRKIDAPSGTAKKLAAEIQNYRQEEVPVTSLRLGTIPGEHILCFAGKDEVIEVKHTAYSKRIFARGALELAKALMEKPAGFYETKDLF